MKARVGCEKELHEHLITQWKEVDNEILQLFPYIFTFLLTNFKEDINLIYKHIALYSKDSLLHFSWKLKYLYWKAVLNKPMGRSGSGQWDISMITISRTESQKNRKTGENFYHICYIIPDRPDSTALIPLLYRIFSCSKLNLIKLNQILKFKP